MIANDILLDAFTRVHESLHHTLGDISPEELIKEPHPSIGWLAWRISRVMDSNVSSLSGREQLWIGEGWAGLTRPISLYSPGFCRPPWVLPNNSSKLRPRSHVDHVMGPTIIRNVKYKI